MPSHGPTEPPDESHGWEDEYDKTMETEEAKALLKDMYRVPDLMHTVIANMEPSDFEDLETDDDDLQAFVQMVYDRGIAYGHNLTADEVGHISLADDLLRQDRAPHVIADDAPPVPLLLDLLPPKSELVKTYEAPGADKPYIVPGRVTTSVGFVTWSQLSDRKRGDQPAHEVGGGLPVDFLPGVTPAARCECGLDLRTPEEKGRSTCEQCWEERGQQDLAMLEASLDDVLGS